MHSMRGHGHDEVPDQPGAGRDAQRRHGQADQRAGPPRAARSLETTNTIYDYTVALLGVSRDG
jgi:hypothetical protein